MYIIIEKILRNYGSNFLLHSSHFTDILLLMLKIKKKYNYINDNFQLQLKKLENYL